MGTPWGDLYDQVKRVVAIANRMQGVSEAVRDMANEIRDIDRRVARLEGAIFAGRQPPGSLPRVEGPED